MTTQQLCEHLMNISDPDGTAQVMCRGKEVLGIMLGTTKEGTPTIILLVAHDEVSDGL